MFVVAVVHHPLENDYRKLGYERQFLEEINTFNFGLSSLN